MFKCSWIGSSPCPQTLNLAGKACQKETIQFTKNIRKRFLSLASGWSHFQVESWFNYNFMCLCPYNNPTKSWLTLKRLVIGLAILHLYLPQQKICNLDPRIKNNNIIIHILPTILESKMSSKFSGIRIKLTCTFAD
jgi:hypothetical protein